MPAFLKFSPLIAWSRFVAGSFLLSFFCAAEARSELTLVGRETFSGVGVFNSSAPSHLGAVSGALYQRPVGPRLTADQSAGGRGWSTLLEGAEANISTAAPTSGVASVWCYADSFPNETGCHYWLIQTQSANRVYQLLSVGAGPSASFWWNSSPLSAQASDSGVAIPIHQWFELRVAWKNLDSKTNTYKCGAYFRLAGTSTWRTVTENLNIIPANGLPITLVNYGVIGDVNSDPASVRIGMPSLFKTGDWANRTLPISDAVDPPAGPFSWYVNPATGSDANDGASPSSAWATADKISAESQFLGILPGAGVMGSGDTVFLDGSAAPLLIGSNPLRLSASGMTLSCIGSEPIQPWTAISGEWSLSAGCAHTWETTDNEATDLASVAVLEDWKLLNHPMGADFTTVQAAMESMPGSFFSDGVKLYVHPFDDTIPGADGKTYVRSRERLGLYNVPGGSAITVNASDVHVTSTQPGGSLLRMTLLARSEDSDPLGAYLLQWDTGGGGTNQVDNFHFDLGSKHLEGRTATASNMSVSRVDCVYGQGSPYVGFGGQTQAVDFCQSGSGNTYSYLRCSSAVNAGVIGSSQGGVVWAYQSWLSHGGAYGVFSGGTFTDCNWCSLLEEDYITAGAISLLRTSSGGATFFGADLTADQSSTTLFPLSVQNGRTLTMRNCVLNLQGATTDYHWATLSGTALIEGCTINFGDNPTGSSPGAVWGRAGPCVVTIKNTALLTSNAHPHALLQGFTAADTLALDHNAYANGGGPVVQQYDGGAGPANLTLAQWQALGFDSGSFSADASLIVDALLVPTAGSPLIASGDNLGALVDFTGKLFAHRTGIGAIEAPPETFRQWQRDYFSDNQLAQPTVSGDLATPAGDGVPNLLKYAFNLDPNVSASAYPSVSMDENGVSLTYSQAVRATDLNYTIEQSPDLVNWGLSNANCAVLSNNGVIEQVNATVPDDETGSLFLRLSVTRNQPPN